MFDDFIVSRDRVRRIFTSRYAKDFYYVISGNIGVAIVGALGGILAARLLGPEGRGELAAAIAWVGILITIGQIDLPKSIIYHIAKNDEERNAVFQSFMFLFIIQSAIIIILGRLIALLVLGIFQPTALDPVLTYIWIVPASLLTTYLNASFQGMKRFGLFGLLRFLSAAVLLFSVLTGYAIGIDTSHEVILLMILFQYVLASIASLLALVFVFKPNWEWQLWKVNSLLVYGAKSYLSSLSWIANARIDQFVMSFSLPLGQLGIYSVAASYAGVIYPLLGSFANVLFPHATGVDAAEAIKKIVRVLTLTLVAGTIGAATLALMSPKLIPLLFGIRFYPAVYPAVVLLVGSIFLGGNYVLGDGLRALGRPLIPSIAETIGLIVTVTGLIFLLKRFGVMGAAFTSFLSYGSVFLILLGSLVMIYLVLKREHQNGY